MLNYLRKTQCVVDDPCVLGEDPLRTIDHHTTAAIVCNQQVPKAKAAPSDEFLVPHCL